MPTPAKYCVQCGNLLEKRIKNPHNPIDEFCSEKCAQADRVQFIRNSPKLYTLFAEGTSGVLGIYNTAQALHRGDKYWRKTFHKNNQPIGRFFYELWVVNYPQEPMEHGWVTKTKP